MTKKALILIVLASLLLSLFVCGSCGNGSTSDSTDNGTGEAAEENTAQKDEGNSNSHDTDYADASLVPSLWDVDMQSVKTAGSLYAHVYRGFSTFCLDDPSNVFLVISFIARPSGDEHSFDTKDVVLTIDATRAHHPIGWNCHKEDLDVSEMKWELYTEGSIDVVWLSSGAAECEYDTCLALPNKAGIIREAGTVTGSMSRSGKIIHGVSPDILVHSLAYVVSMNNIQSGGLELTFLGTQPIILTIES